MWMRRRRRSGSRWRPPSTVGVGLAAVAGPRRRSRSTATTTPSSRFRPRAGHDRADYAVEVDGSTVWPPLDSPYPPSRIATLKADRDLRLAFGSCRTSIPHDEEGNRAHGVDAMRAYALHMAGSDADKWPDLVAFLGDQVYADLTSPAMQEFIASRRDPSEPPGEELKDYEEYAHLYKLAWTDPANRWLLSTLPSSMIFDDHDIRDDWNTSLDWRREMEADVVVEGPHRRRAGSYWVYQHLGNLSPDERADDEIWSQICAQLAERRRAGRMTSVRCSMRSPSGPTPIPTATAGAMPATSGATASSWSTRGLRGC